MPLTEEQRAMLQLLLERHQTYADIGSLLGLDVDAVRSRARGALTEIGGQDPDRDVGLTDYLLGQADPIGRADVARHLQVDPEANALAQKLISQLRLLAPNAELPSPPAPRAQQPEPTASPSPVPAAATSGGVAPSLSSRQRRLIAALIGGAAVVALVVLVATGAFSGGGDNDGADTTAASSVNPNGSTDNSQLTRAVLAPENGGSARGVVIFGRVRNVPVLEVRAVGLTPNGKNENYSVWLYRNNKVALRIGGVRVGKTGRILAQIPIPAQALGFVANGTFDSIVVTNTSDAAFKAEVTRARQEKRLPRLTGEVALRGKISGPAVQRAAAGGGSTGSSGPSGSPSGQAGG